MDPETIEALHDFKRRLERRFGDRLKGVYLFGSRARGDHRPDSDADVAVVLDERIERRTWMTLPTRPQDTIAVMAIPAQIFFISNDSVIA